MRRALRNAIGASVISGVAACGGRILLGEASRSDGDDGGAHNAGLATNGIDGSSIGGPIVFGPLAVDAVDAGIAVGRCSFPSDAANRWLLFDSDAVAYHRDVYAMRADGSALLRLTTDLYNEQNPTVSPNGRFLAFVSDRTDSNQIYVRDLATGTLTQLTTMVAGADQPSWSSDSSRIAFHSGASVWSMAADGSGQRVVATGDFNACEYPSFSLDGTQVVYGWDFEIDAVHLDGMGKRLLLGGETPAVSPDGTLVAYAVQCGASEQIAITPFAGNAMTPFAGDASVPCPPRPITAPSGLARRPAWGPSGIFAFELTRPQGGAPASIAVIAPDAGASCVLVGGLGDNRNPSWAPAGYEPR